MAETGLINQLNEDSKNFWTGMDNKKKIIFSISAIALIGLVAFLFSMVFKPHYQVLYSDLKQSDAAAIGSYLEKGGIKYQVLNNGGTIAVTDTSVPKMRLELANKGLPKGSGVGFEIFDKANITVTDFGQKLNYVRALEGELSRTISSLDTVKQAKVHLAIAKKSLFKDEEEKTSASVIIVPAYGSDLSSEQVKGIRHLVSSAINDLNAENVQITDSSGKSLVEYDDNSNKIERQMMEGKKATKSYEKSLEGSLLELLTPILGKGNVLVNVTADLNFDESEMNIEVYSPTIGENTADPVIRSEQISREKYNNDSKANGGVPGTENNIPTFAGSKTKQNDDSKDYLKEDIVKNYEVSRTVERVRKASGIINKLSVAVVINKDITPAERATLRKTVSVAAGLDLERGDQVAITGIRFSSNQGFEEEQSKLVQDMQNMTNLSLVKKFGSLGLAVIMAAFLIIGLLTNMKKPLSAGKARELDSILDEEEAPLLEALNQKLLAQESKLANPEEASDLDNMRIQLSKLSIDDPESVSKALRSFIDE